MRSSASNPSSSWCDMVMDRAEIELALGQAADRLAGKGFAQRDDILSQRIPEQEAFLSLEISGQDGERELRWSGLLEPHSALHQHIYTARPDVGAIVSCALPWTSALSSMQLSLPAVFDEQVRHLGVEVARLQGSWDSRSAFANGANAYMLGSRVLCFGMNLDRLMANIEILEKCSQSYLLARSASAKVKRIPWLIKYIANGRLKKDQKDAAMRHRRGERAITKAGY